MRSSNSRYRRLFERITARPTLAVICGLLVTLLAGSGLTKLAKDTSVKAFIPPGHESLLADAKTTEIFGLSDTIAIAMITTDGRPVFEPALLTLIDDLTAEVADLPNIRYDRVSSLATESAISGSDDVVYIDPYIASATIDQEDAQASYARWQGMTPHHGTLVSDDGVGAIILAEVVDAQRADDTYLAVLDLVTQFDQPGVEFHVAGPGAVSGYLSRYIDNDARKLQPLVFLVVLFFVYLAFRRGAALSAPLVVVIGAAAGALGIMGWLGIPYYAITNALPVIVVAISVADAIHILSQYFQLREQHPTASTRDCVIGAMCEMARPITLTTITTIAGFAGIAALSIMPPITWFAVFASLGVFLAWAFSMLVLPNVLLLMDPGRSPAFASWSQDRPSGLAHTMGALGSFSCRHHRAVVTIFILIGVIAAYGAMQLRIDRSQVENFATDEPIRIADETINATFAGTAFLDIIVETDNPGDLLTVDAMEKTRQLQAHFESLPHVRKTFSVVDTLAQLHGALDSLDIDAVNARQLPDTDALLAETLFVYEVSGDPTDLEEEIDSDYQYALVRGVLDAHHFSQTRDVVESLQQYIATEFNDDRIRATLTGDINVTYHWMTSLQSSHFKSVLLSLSLVLVTSALVFRSCVRGVIAVVPVSFTVLSLYACMGYLGVYLEPATSMFAAIALGVGVDFAIHLVDRLQFAAPDSPDWQSTVDQAMPSVARACFFNSAALGIGFAVLMVSDLPTLVRFGGLVTLATFSSYVVALMIVPALFALLQRRAHQPSNTRSNVGRTAVIVAACLIVSWSDDAAAETLSAGDIARAITDRQEGDAARRVIHMTMIDRKGKSESRVAVVHKQRLDDRRLTRVTFLEPKKYRNMAFLSHDYLASDGADSRWMFLPAAQRVRSIPATRRGGAFFGTDFSYEDVQSEMKFKLEDWHFEYGGSFTVDGQIRHRLSGTPQNKTVAKELGYGSFSAIVDERSWMPVNIDFTDVKLRPLKTIEVRSFQQIDDVWTPGEIVATNHRTEHRTVFEFRDTQYPPSLSQSLFESRTLGRRLSDPLQE